MPSRAVANFGAGPACLPRAVLERIQQEWWDWRGTGMNVMEVSHRSAEWEATMKEAEARLRSLLAIPKDDYAVLFMPGGGTGQFAAWLLNLVDKEKEGINFLVNGTWSKKAYEEAVRLGYRAVKNGEGEADFVYYCDNETVDGIERSVDFPTSLPPSAKIVADLSSNFLSRPVRIDRYACVFATAQKNFGVAGVTVVIVKRSLVRAQDLPSILDYGLFDKHGSLYNTPPVMPIYVLNLMLEWIEVEGGLVEMDRRAREKSSLLYQLIDAHPSLRNGIPPELRSRMNVVFHTHDDERFLRLAKEGGLVGLAGHRSVGGLRASLYNAMPLEEVRRLYELLREFTQV